MDDLVTWLRAQLDEDERVARAASDWPWEATISSSGEQGDVQGVTSAFEDYCCSAEDAAHIARWDPARVLAEVDAKRQMLDWLAESELSDGTTWSFNGDELLKLLALPYADRSGFREEGRPDGS
jgi:hypothetical protein